MKENDFNNIVVLIDAENISHTYLNAIFESVAAYGNIAVRRIYADWTAPRMASWKQLLQDFSLIPIQQFNNAGLKNVSDFTMVIDAMDLVHEEMFDCFCIVSSDSDFTRLAQRMREKGRFVIGFGEKKASKSFVNACNTFIYTENLRTKTPEPSKTGGRKGKSYKDSPNRKTGRPVGNEHEQRETPRDDIIEIALDKLKDNDGWVLLSQIIPYAKRIRPEFELNDLHVRRLIDYFNEEEYEIRKVSEQARGPIYIRRK